MQITTLISLLAIASIGAAAPAHPSKTSATEGTVAPTLATASGGALAPTFTPRPRLNIAAPPQYLTISIVNSHGDAITTSHARAAGAATPVGGAIGPGTIANGATASFAVPTGWAGNIAVNDGGYAITGDDSLIEANFDVPSGYSFAVADVDVSYVNGFSAAITCSCSGQVVTGCNKNLFNLHTCANNDGQNACVNPERASTSATSATPFFAPCQGAAYTFPNDNGANSFGQCQSGHITCCVGAACPANPKQPS